MKRILALLPLALLILIGCDAASKSESSNSEHAGKDTSTALTESLAKGGPDSAKSSPMTVAPTGAPAKSDTASPTETKGDKSGPQPASSTTAPAAEKAADSGVPIDYKHAGYDYEGLANTNPIDMELDISGQASPITGSQQVIFEGFKDGKASYKVDRTGGLEALGSETISLEKGGIYTTHSTVAKLSPHAMELPADPKPGMTWKMHTSADTSTAKMDMEITCKVIGTQSVTTKVGTYKDALLVEQDGVGTLQGKKVRTVSKNWYVKGLGNIKADLTTYDEKGKKEQTLTIQETKH